MTQRVVTHIKTSNLTKSYDGTPAVKSVSITVKSGRTLIIAGPNGGGKTTLIDCLSGLLSPDNPSAIQRPNSSSTTTAIDIRRTIGYVPDEDDTVEYLTATEYFQLVAAAYKQPSDKTVTTSLQLLRHLDFDLKKAKSLIRGYSHGMKKKIQLAAILAANPPIIIIDEPTNGLDPTAVLLLRKVLAMPRFSNTAFIIATHNLTFAESLGGELLLLQQSPLAYGNCQQLLSENSVNSLEALYESLVTIPA